MNNTYNVLYNILYIFFFQSGHLNMKSLYTITHDRTQRSLKSLKQNMSTVSSHISIHPHKPSGQQLLHILCVRSYFISTQKFE
jgi:hypothetical protein